MDNMTDIYERNENMDHPFLDCVRVNNSSTQRSSQTTIHSRMFVYNPASDWTLPNRYFRLANGRFGGFRGGNDFSA